MPVNFGRNSGRQQVLVDLSSFKATLNGEGVDGIVDLIKSNMHETARTMKRKMAHIVKQRIDGGVDGATYTPRYAAIKSILQDGSYTSRGPVDLDFTGQLMRSLTGRGRARPARGQVRVWLGHSRQARSPSPRSPGAKPSGGDITNRQLRDILNGETTTRSPRKTKLDTQGRPPIALHGDETTQLIRETIQKLMRDSGAR